MFKHLLLLLSLCLVVNTATAQKDWHLQPAVANKTYGADVINAYKQLENKKPERVIVAVLDNGTDIQHEGLKPFIWTNEKEIAGNGKDDDGNGYVDDVHGWNFLGGAKENMGYVSLQETRNYQMLHRKYKDIDSAAVAEADTAEYNKYQKELKRYNKEEAWRKASYTSSLKFRKLYDNNLSIKLLSWATMGLKTNSQLDEMVEYSHAQMIYNSLDADSLRKAIVGDDPNNPHQRYYGNNNVIGHDPTHGTHTAGIIASVAKSGTEDWLRIMPLRTVPTDGDEYDKDVANSIRYAVDHGAKVISMSFGKKYSPFSTVVDSAILYAQAHDVLLVHGAGNDGRKLDSTFKNNHPNPYIDSNTFVPNWIEVGANGKKAKRLVAIFSNYGKKSVDVFAPGVKVYATVPDNKYAYLSGTSMAAPVVAGVAAMLRSYFPTATAVEIKNAIMQSTSPCSVPTIRKTSKGKKALSLSNICVSGGVINAAKAVSKLKAGQ